MSKLILSLDDTFLGEFPLEKKYVTIGRRPTNDVHIDNLAISGEHARVVTIDGMSTLEDLDSTNGSTVNGEPVKKQPLHHGDVIGISKYQIRFIDEAALDSQHKPVPEQFASTILVHPTAKPATTSAHADDARKSREQVDAEHVAELPPASIQILNGPGKGKELQLSKSLTTLGKPGELVAVISRRPQGYFITHVEGDHHPLVNGGSIGVQAHQLKNNDVIELAGVKMGFYLSNS